MSQRQRVLILEDSEDSLELYRFFLEREGYEVSGASTIAEATAILEGSSYDVLVSDIGLPDGSGIDFVRRLRDAGFTKPAIALTGSAKENARDVALAAGFTDYCRKPCAPEDLLGLIER